MCNVVYSYSQIGINDQNLITFEGMWHLFLYFGLHTFLILELTFSFSAREPLLSRPVHLRKTKTRSPGHDDGELHKVTQTVWRGGDAKSKLLSASFTAVMHQHYQGRYICGKAKKKEQREQMRELII